MTEHIMALGPCYSCKTPFWFDPDTIQSVPIDPVTKMPPDLGGDPDRAVNQPICVPCRKKANVKRAAAGQRLWPIPEEDGL